MRDESTRIGLIFDCSQGYCRGVLRGIKTYAEVRPGWVFTLVPPDPLAIERLRALRPAGLIAHIFSDSLASTLLAFRRPLVNISGVLTDLAVPKVVVDDRLVGRLAASHLLGHGLKHFAFVGHSEHGYSILRESGYREVLQAAGFSIECYHGRDSQLCDPRAWRLWALDTGIRTWMDGLRRPVGIFASTDVWGHQLLEVCRQIGLRVPDDVAIIGVDNDDLLCDLARPSLSSVAIPTGLIGSEAAGLLDGLLSHPKAPRSPILLPPLGVVTRQSTDVLAVGDPDVVAAVRFIRERLHTPIQVADVLRAVPASRRTLELRFRAVLNRGLAEEIRRARIERASDLLTSTDAPMTEVARRSGFSDAKQFSAVFIRETSLAPTAYRRGARGHGAARSSPSRRR
jgi:LacI family transcriptional regulator